MAALRYFKSKYLIIQEGIAFEAWGVSLSRIPECWSFDLKVFKGVFAMYLVLTICFIAQSLLVAAVSSPNTLQYLPPTGCTCLITISSEHASLSEDTEKGFSGTSASLRSFPARWQFWDIYSLTGGSFIPSDCWELSKIESHWHFGRKSNPSSVQKNSEYWLSWRSWESCLFMKRGHVSNSDASLPFTSVFFFSAPVFI